MIPDPEQNPNRQNVIRNSYRSWRLVTLPAGHGGQLALREPCLDRPSGRLRRLRAASWRTAADRFGVALRRRFAGCGCGVPRASPKPRPKAAAFGRGGSRSTKTPSCCPRRMPKLLHRRRIRARMIGLPWWPGNDTVGQLVTKLSRHQNAHSTTPAIARPVFHWPRRHSNQPPTSIAAPQARKPRSHQIQSERGTVSFT